MAYINVSPVRVASATASSTDARALTAAQNASKAKAASSSSSPRRAAHVARRTSSDFASSGGAQTRRRQASSSMHARYAPSPSNAAKAAKFEEETTSALDLAVAKRCVDPSLYRVVERAEPRWVRRVRRAEKRVVEPRGDMRLGFMGLSRPKCKSGTSNRDFVMEKSGETKTMSSCASLVVRPQCVGDVGSFRTSSSSSVLARGRSCRSVTRRAHRFAAAASLVCNVAGRSSTASAPAVSNAAARPAGATFALVLVSRVSVRSLLKRLAGLFFCGVAMGGSMGSPWGFIAPCPGTLQTSALGGAFLGPRFRRSSLPAFSTRVCV